MKKNVLESIIPPTFIAAIIFIGIDEIIVFSTPVALIISGLVLLGLANIGKKFNKKS